jgi:hypothetical protein
MEYLVPVLFITVTIAVTVFAVKAVKARAWQRRNTYLEEFWHSNGW